jgi:hypothetical protein
VTTVAFGPGGEDRRRRRVQRHDRDRPGQPVTAVGDRDGFVALLDREGRAVRAWTGGSTGRDSVTAVRLARAGSSRPVTSRAGSWIGGHEPETRGSTDGYVSRSIRRAGRVGARLRRWGQDAPRSLAVDPDGTIRLTGKHRFDAEFAGRPMHARGVIDGFVVELRLAK